MLDVPWYGLHTPIQKTQSRQRPDVVAMDRPSDSQRPAAPAPPEKSTRTKYLTLYNLGSTTAWLQIFYRVALVVAVGGGWEKVFAESDNLVRIVQTAAMLEVAHAALGRWFSHAMREGHEPQRT